MSRAAALAFAMAWIAGEVALAAEFQLRSRCQPRGPIVLLGDVAEVLATDGAEAARLAATELFPTPPPGLQRILRLRQLQDLLADRGVNLAEHRFSGSSQVIVSGASEAGAAEPSVVGVSAIKQAKRLVEAAIVKHLEAQAAADEAWQVEADLTDAIARRVVNEGATISIRGGRPPWTGIQEFELVLEQKSPSESLPLKAKIARLPRVVVAARNIARGESIRAGDVILCRPEPGAAGGAKFHSLDEVVGLEAAQTIAAGTVLQRSLVRAPIMVRRGELIVVYSRAAGIRIRTTARAKEDAALGELVALESLTDRKTFTARVCGPQEAEVYARALPSSPIKAGESALRAEGERPNGLGRNL
jgi:flagella basal body P-ring formation protein FlgA